MTQIIADPELRLGFEGFEFSDLFRPERLKELSEIFDQTLANENSELYKRWLAYRNNPGEVPTPIEVSALLVGVSGHVSRFVSRLFGVESESAALAAATADQDPIFRFKTEFVRRRVLPHLKTIVVPMEPSAVAELESSIQQLCQAASDAADPNSDLELAIAQAAVKLLNAEKAFGEKGTAVDRERSSGFLQRLSPNLKGDPSTASVAFWIQSLSQWCALHLHDVAFRRWVSFRFPEAVDHFDLVQVQRPLRDFSEIMLGPDSSLRRRDGFDLTDKRMTNREVLGEVHYCILCHEREKDSCRKGITNSDGAVAANPLDIPLEGCPLDERISEMHYMRKRGDVIAALALVMITNPMCPGTGHRICNDCMKACIYQKQEPVNIPEIETSVLTDTLSLPWGVEIYGLLTRWNPLNIGRPYALPYNGKNVLVVGMGPAGYTLAHYLANEGFGVAGIDGLKIEPLNADLIGSGDTPPLPVRSWRDIYRPLDERILEGFGGVSEYGITVRWDKNFLTLLYLTLARRTTIRIYGGVRFGGTVTVDDAWDLGFDHIAIATGAGRPTIIEMKNNLASGIRKASDFLMALQLTGAFKKDTLSNLQVRLPAVVIGGGLTGIDTATELFAYYPVQVEKMLAKYEQVTAEFGEEDVLAKFDEEELRVLQEFLEHGKEIREERARAEAAGEDPNFVPLVQSWGGVSLIYRKRLQDSPAYRLNHEEVQKALEEGIDFVECMNPAEAVPDEFNAVKALIFERLNYNETTGKFENTGDMHEFPARTVCVAAGTSPNVIYEKEKPGTFKLDEWRQFFLPHKLERNGDGEFHVVESVKSEAGFFTSYEQDGKFISYYGDNHPKYAGNVVKAMASAKDGYAKVTEIFADELATRGDLPQWERDAIFDNLEATLDEQLRAYVVRVERLTPTIVDVVVKAPLQARKFEPGQFYRLQNFETAAPVIDGTRLVMEGLALTGAWVDEEKGLLSMIVLEMGTSSRLCSLLKEGEEVLVMGPTGTPTEIPENENVLLAGGGLGNAVLFSIARALQAKNNKVLYFAGYKNGHDLFKREEIEKDTDQVIWATDYGDEIQPHRAQDAHFRGNIVQAMVAYAEGRLGQQSVSLGSVDRIIAIGSDRMMNGVREARHTTLKPYLKEQHTAIGSINSPMQCMMKEVCAQCLQRHVNPHTGEEFWVFSCFNQDQHLDFVDFKNLNERLRANSIQEKLTNLWLDKAFAKEGIRKEPEAAVV